MSKLLTEREAAQLLRVSRSRVKALVPRLKLSARGTRYDAADVERLIERLKVRP